MRHNKSSRTFSRKTRPARAMFANMTSDLITHGRISTTIQKAKELRKYAERMITLGKTGDLHSRRRAMAYMGSKSAVTKLFDVIAPIYKDRSGGYTRILKTGIRPGDAATMAIIELVEEELPTPRTNKKPKKTKKIEKKIETKAEEKVEISESKSEVKEEESAPEATTEVEAKAEESAPKAEAKAEEAAPEDKAEPEAKAEEDKKEDK